MADIKVYGTLRTMATDGIVATADQLKDTNVGKFQEVINQELAGGMEGKQDTIADLEQIRSLANSAVQPSVLQAAIADFITKSVDDLVNYYKKSETYTKAEVNGLIGAIKQFTYRVAPSLPTASESTMYIIYLIPSSNASTQNVKDEFITIQDGSSYSWEQIGSTKIDLSGYSTTEQMNAAILSGLNNLSFSTGEKVANLGIDEEPTAGSDNLVKSGGVKKTINGYENNISQLDRKKIKCVLQFDNETQEVIVHPTKNANDAILFYPIEQGKSYRISVGITRSGRVWGFCDNYLTSRPSEDTNIGGVITADAPGSYLEYTKEITNTDGYSYLVIALKADSTASCVQIIDSNVVLYNKAQYRPDNEKETARNNINAASKELLNEVIGVTENIVGKEKYDTYMSSNSRKTTTFTLPMAGGRKVRLTNLSSSGYSTNDISIYYDRVAAGTRLYSSMDLSEFPFEFILHFDVSAIAVVDNGTTPSSSPKQKWQLEYQNDISGALPDLEKYTKTSLNGFGANLYYGRLVHQIISPSVVVGEAVSFGDSGYRTTFRFNVTGLQGKISIGNIMAYGSGKDVVICDSEGIVIAIVSYQMSTDSIYSVIIDMSDYQGAAYIYAIGNPSSPVTAYNYSDGIIKMCEDTDILPKKGALLLHFDQSITPEDPRIDIIEEYGFKVSWCISPSTFSNTNKFSGDWTSEAHRQLYWRLIENGADIGIYPNTIKTTEAEWDEFFDAVLSNLSAKGIYNITTVHCGQLVVNDGLLASAPKFGIHILRGGGRASDGDTYPYTEENSLVPIKPSQKTMYVLSSGTIGSTYERLENRLDSAIEKNRVYSCFSHGIGTGTTDISEESFRGAMDVIASKVAKGLTLVNWREFYRMMNPIDGSSNDYLRLLKMAKE